MVKENLTVTVPVELGLIFTVSYSFRHDFGTKNPKKLNLTRGLPTKNNKLNTYVENKIVTLRFIWILQPTVEYAMENVNLNFSLIEKLQKLANQSSF